MSDAELFARLVVRDAAAAIDFYASALGATELARYTSPSGAVVHAELRVGSSVLSLTEDDGDGNISPSAIGGSPVLLMLLVPDARQVARSMEVAGAEVLIPVADRYYGYRDGRLKDPFGHLWLITQDAEDLSPEEIQRRVDDAEA